MSWTAKALRDTLAAVPDDAPVTLNVWQEDIAAEVPADGLSVAVITSGNGETRVVLSEA